MGRQQCETHLQGRVKTELEHHCFLWEDKKSNEQPVHKLQNEGIWQLSRMDVQNMGRSQGHDAAAVGEYWSLLWVTEELYESVPLRRCTTITWDGGEDRCLPRRCCKDRQITQQRQSDDLCASEQGAQLILRSCVLGSLVLVQLFLACSTDRKMVWQKRESFCANLMS